jgi:ribonuclease PH
MRPSRRAPDELRAVSLERGVVKYAEGSCMVKFGDTHVLVTATLEERLPPWLKGQGRGCARPLISRRSASARSPSIAT